MSLRCLLLFSLFITWEKAFSQVINFTSNGLTAEYFGLYSLDLSTCIVDTLYLFPHSKTEGIWINSEHIIGPDGKVYVVIKKNDLLILCYVDFSSELIIPVDTLPAISAIDQVTAMAMTSDSILIMCTGERPNHLMECFSYDFKTQMMDTLGSIVTPGQNPAFAAMYIYEGDIILMGNYIAKLDTLNNRVIPLTGDHYFPGGGAVFIRVGCDSTALITNGGNFLYADGSPKPMSDLSNLNIFDPVTFQSYSLCLDLDYPLHRIFGMSIAWEYNAAIPCNFSIDLDEDNSTTHLHEVATDNDFVDTIFCREINLSLTDQDLSLDGNVLPDSIYLFGSFPPDFQYQYSGSDPSITFLDLGQNGVIIPSDSTSMGQLSTFLREIRIVGQYESTTSEAQAQFISYRDGVSLDTAITFLIFDIENYLDTEPIFITICDDKNIENVLLDGISHLPSGGFWIPDYPDPDFASTYYYVIQYLDCPTDSIQVNITWEKAKEVKIKGDSILCNDHYNVLSLSDTDFLSVLWSNDEESDSIEIAEPGWYSITVTDFNNCETYDSIWVMEAEEFNILVEDSNCNDEVWVSIRGNTNISNIRWSTGDVEKDSIAITENGNYDISITDENGCSNIIPFSIDCFTQRYDIPNVFSPNGDGINDEFILNSLAEVDYVIHIYDRWGNEVFYCETQDSPCLWDGSNQKNGKPLSIGVYTYTIHLINEDRFMSGNVTLVR